MRVTAVTALLATWLRPLAGEQAALEPASIFSAPPDAVEVWSGSTNAHFLTQAVPYAQCLRNSGRLCNTGSPDRPVVDSSSQCNDFQEVPAGSDAVLKEVEKCSTGSPWPSGFCICNPGWCADGTNKCSEQENEILDDVFTITTKQHGPTQYLYMGVGGQLALGVPTNFLAARWKIAKTHDGVYHLYTLAFPQDLLDSYEECAARVEPVSQIMGMSCYPVVGHVPKPPAAETGWHIDTYDDTYVTLRSKDTSRVLYIDEIKLRGRTCSTAYDPQQCPGSYGALLFDPPLPGASRSAPPMHPLFLVAHLALVSLIVLLVCCGCVINFRFDSASSRWDAGLCQVLCGVLCCHGKTTGERVRGTFAA